ncbi:MAG TPA: ArsR family transcriptional regulator [Pyrinomonadaceae bacterium]|nr:ArsR family transcriptional regulator [Pyrinomonadaceae bacterium]
MKRTKLDNRFFESTRGRIVMLLRGSSRTVEELAKELGLTDNAVRAHLLTLERDGLIEQSGLTKGFRKPHFAYDLTTEAEHLFPKSYDALFNQLIEVLKNRLSSKDLKEALYEVGRKIAGKQTSNLQSGDNLNERVEKAVKALAELGGAAEAVDENDRIIISSKSCPLAASVADHPEVCKLAESLVQEIVGVYVKENCNREQMPQCRFEIARVK